MLKRCSVVLLILLLVWIAGWADVIHLKNGTTVSGTITEITDSTVTISSPQFGIRTYPLSSVLYIERTSATTTGQTPVVVLQQQQQQQQAPGWTSSLTMEQEWNNALYYAKLKEKSDCSYHFLEAWLYGILLIGLGSWLASSYQYEYGDPLTVVGVTTSYVLGGLLLLGGVADLIAGGPRSSQCATARQEVRRLEQIGRAKGWVYLGRLIQPPTPTAEVIVKNESDVGAWLSLFYLLSQSNNGQ